MAPTRFALFLLLIFALGGCTYAPQRPVYNESKYIKPLPAGLMVGPPMVESHPSASLVKEVKPLPPALIVPGRNLYFFASVYYYYWDGDWFFSRNRTGPWYLLSKKYYPSEVAHLRPGPQTPIDIEKPFTAYPPYYR
ncbi:MAG: hypothetical protein M0Z48_09585 [Nitrospiraceae bacterium]|nr:hypothetical protein [Nitrospiraceae bacterium]